MRSVLLCPECDAKVTPPYAQGKVPYLYECPTCRSLTPRPELKRIWDHIRLTGAPPVAVAEDDLNEAQTREIVRQELMGMKYLSLDENAASVGPAATTLFQGGFHQAGYTERVFGACRYINLAGTNNRVFEKTLETLVVGSTPLIGFYGSTLRMQCIVNPPTPPEVPLGDAPSVGIHFGTGGAPPYNVNYVTNFNPVVQFRYNFLTASFETMVYNGDGITPPTVTAADINPTFGPDTNMAQFRVDYSGTPSPVARWYLNGALAATLSGAYFEETISILGSNHIGPGYFITNATSTTGGTPWTAPETGFYGFSAYLPNGLMSSSLA